MIKNYFIKKRLKKKYISNLCIKNFKIVPLLTLLLNS